MSKLIGLKNSTVKMRNVKPSTLSTVFTLAEGKQSEIIDINIASTDLSEINFQEIAANLL